MKVSVSIRLEKDLNDWLNEEFPHGFKQMFVEESLTCLRTLIEEGRLMTNKDMIHSVARESISKLGKE